MTSQEKLLLHLPNFLHYKGQPVGTLKQVASVIDRPPTTLYRAIREGRLEQHDLTLGSAFLYISDVINHLNSVKLGRPKLKGYN